MAFALNCLKFDMTYQLCIYLAVAQYEMLGCIIIFLFALFTILVVHMIQNEIIYCLMPCDRKIENINTLVILLVLVNNSNSNMAGYMSWRYIRGVT